MTFVPRECPECGQTSLDAITIEGVYVTKPIKVRCPCGVEYWVQWAILEGEQYARGQS